LKDISSGESEFNRTLGPFSASTLIVGSIIGIGIFTWVSKVGDFLRSPPLILSAWAIGGMVALIGSLCLSELAAAYPRTGGTYVYFRKAFGPFIAFEYAWAKFFIMRVGSFSIQTMFFAQFTAELLDIDVHIVQKPIAISALAFIVGINILGVKWGSLTQNILTIIKILSLLCIIFIGAAVGIGLLNTMDTEPLAAVSVHPDRPPYVLYGLALIAIMWTFGGWDESPFVAEEIVRPERNIPISLIGGLLVCVILYVSTNAAYLAVLGPQDFISSEESTATLFLEKTLGTWAKLILSIILMTSTFGTANGFILTSARIIYATGRDNRIFSWFARTNKATRTPVRGLLIQLILGTTAIIIMDDPFNLLIFTGFAYWIFSALVPLALVILRYKDPERPRPFRVLLYPLTPLLFFIASLIMTGAVIKNDILNVEKWIDSGSLLKNPPTTFVSLLVFAVGAIVFMAQRIKKLKNK
jgi:APA family basic amino acid/polyamine antiporter